MTATATYAPPPTTTSEPDASTLAGEHALMLRDVRRRVEPILALVGTRTWPEAELRTLTAFLRSTVLRQASDEEVFLFPTGAAAPFQELTAEHARLYTLTEQLDEADLTSCTLAQLRALVEQVLYVLRRHLEEERAVLAALAEVPEDVPAAAELVAESRAWRPDQESPVLVMLDALPEDRAVQWCVERLLRLRPGQSAEIHSGDETALRRIFEWMHGFDSTRFGLAWQHAGLSRPALQVSRRDTA